ncbi:MAG: thioredoxin family protein [Actinomycetes bacterium]
MALHSSMIPLGTPLPDFTLPDLDDNLVDLARLRGDGALLVVFAANHCPYVIHLESALGSVVDEFAGRPLATVAISSNDVDAYPADDVDGIRDQQSRAGWHFQYLVDSDQSAAQAFGAACTPDFFLYGFDGRLAYRGAFDRSTPGNGRPLTGDALRTAIGAVLAGAPVPEPHQPSMGCSIKWLPENEPA